MTTLAKLDQDYLLCRDLRHQWEMNRNELLNQGKTRFLIRVTSCLRCGTERHETISLTTFKVLRRAYAYPSDYLLDEKSTFAQIREASIKLQLKKLKQAKP